MNIPLTKISSFFLLISLLSDSYAQNLVPYRKGAKWGFADSTGVLLVKCEYDETFFPENGMAFIKSKGKFGLMNAKGQEVIPPKYKSIGYFHDGVALLEAENGKYGFADEKGEIVIPPKFEYAGNFNQGTARAKSKGKWGLINKEGKAVADFEYNQILFAAPNVYYAEKDKKWGTLNSQGMVTIPIAYDSIGTKLSEGYRMVAIHKKWGLLDKTGKEVLTPEFDEIYEYGTEDFYLAKGEKRFRYLKETQQLVEDTQLGEGASSSIAFFSEWKEKHAADIESYKDIKQGFAGTLLATKDSKWGVLDTNMQKLTEFVYDSVQSIGDMYAIRKAGKWGLFGVSQKTLISYCRFTNIVQERNNKIVAFIGEDCGMIDATGKMLIPCIYEDLTVLEGGFVRAKMKGKYGILNQDGDLVTPFKYKEIEVYGDDYALITSIDDKKGIFSFTQSKIVIPAMFEELVPWNNLFIIKQKGEYGLIDLKGKIVQYTQYQDYKLEQTHAYLRVTKKDKVGWLDSTGRMFIPIKYEASGSWYRGHLPVQLKGKWGVVDSIGRVTIPFEYQEIHTPEVAMDFMEQVSPYALTPDTDLGMVWVKGANNFWGIKKLNGENVITPRYDEITPMEGYKGLFVTKLAARYGLVNTKDEELLATGYDDIYSSGRGFLIAQQGKKFALLSAEGAPITQFKYQDVLFNENDRFVWVIYDNKKGIVNTSGKEFFEKD